MPIGAGVNARECRDARVGVVEVGFDRQTPMRGGRDHPHHHLEPGIAARHSSAKAHRLRLRVEVRDRLRRGFGLRCGFGLRRVGRLAILGDLDVFFDAAPHVFVSARLRWVVEPVHSRNEAEVGQAQLALSGRGGLHPSISTYPYDYLVPLDFGTQDSRPHFGPEQGQQRGAGRVGRVLGGSEIGHSQPLTTMGSPRQRSAMSSF